MPLFAFTDADRWVPGIGDPTFMGWFTVAAYFTAFALCLRVLVILRQTGWSKRELVFWGGMTFLMFALGINKQLDLQTWFTLTAKKLAQSEGWYEKRRYFQAVFIAAISVGGILAIMLARSWTRSKVRNTFLPLAGALFLGCFVVVRAASFHHVDQMLGLRLAGFKMNWILELGGIALVALGAWKAARALRTTRSQSTGFIWVTAGDRLGPS